MSNKRILITIKPDRKREKQNSFWCGLIAFIYNLQLHLLSFQKVFFFLFRFKVDNMHHFVFHFVINISVATHQCLKSL